MWRAENLVDAIYRASYWAEHPAEIRRHIVDQQEYGIEFEYLNEPNGVENENAIAFIVTNANGHFIVDELPANRDELVNRPITVRYSKIVPGLNEPLDILVDIAPALLEKFAGMTPIGELDVGIEFRIDSNGFKIRDLEYPIDEIYTDDERDTIGVFTTFPKWGRILRIVRSHAFHAYNVEVVIDGIEYIINAGPHDWEPVWSLTIHGRTISGRFDENFDDEVRGRCLDVTGSDSGWGFGVSEVVVDEF